MKNKPSIAAVEPERQHTIILWDPLVEAAAPAFRLAGIMIMASMIIPVGLEAFTDRAWVAGLVLVGVAVVVAALGLLGLYPWVNDTAPVLAKTGALFSVIGGTAALTLLAGVAVVLVADVAVGPNLRLLKGAFMTLVLLMAGGYSLGFLSFGIGSLRTEVPSRTVGRLLVVGGVVLLVPVVGQLLRLGFGIGPPPWVAFLMLGLSAVITLSVGYSLDSEKNPFEAPQEQ
jgi:hypothetical protein